MSRKKKFGLGATIAALLLACAVAYPHIRYMGVSSPIPWVSYEEGLKAAKAAGRPILIDVGWRY
ncbi:MAG: hypothetical protein HYZ53_29840 [Planctomycetes bacterium]|nr:hypothetical protein [Planctomycetota bacterium]